MQALDSFSLAEIDVAELKPEELESTSGGCLFCVFIDSILGYFGIEAGEGHDH